MIILMLASLLLTSITGIAIYGAEEQAGPLATWFANTSHFWEEAFEESHEFFANLTLLLVIIHVAGVVIESIIHQENLVRAMTNGRKRS
jgi:cytochrome b